MSHEYVLAEVKAVEGKAMNGEFEAVISAPTLDRDGEVIDTRAFEPLPASIPIHAFHDFHDPVGRAAPYYDASGVLRARGTYASTPRAQEIRTLVAEGVIGHMSVGFMGATRDEKDGQVHITGAELLEASFVSVPSNREAALTLAKEYVEKAGARNSATDAERLQAIHDLATANGAKCVSPDEADADDAGKTLSDAVVAGIQSGVEKAGTAIDRMFDDLVEHQKSTVTDPEPSPALVAADAPADVSVARARAAQARAHLALNQ
jgi:HK97 family phage prohead protease